MKNKLLIALVALTILAPAVTAQDLVSPYSKFGYGILNDNATSMQRQMGGIGYAMTGGRQINAMNPAAYASRDTLTFLFDMGLDFAIIKTREGDKSEKQYGGGLDYITMQFPAGKRVGMSLGLIPYSSVGYSFGSDINNGVAKREGTGGLNQLYLGAGVRTFKGLNLGVNISYLFGTTFNDVYATTTSQQQALFEQVMEVRDYHLQFGAQYSYNITPKHRLTAGLTYSPGKSLLGRTWVVKYAVDNTSTLPDTVASSRLNGNFSLPDTWGAGINYEWNNRLMAEIDFTYQPWKNVKFQEMDNFIASKFDNRWRIAAGLQYTPNPRGGYFKRMNYRLGGFYNHDYIMVNDNNVKDFGLSAGFGFPAVAGKTVINLGFEWRHRTSSPVKLVTENYFNITLGINFNERWFMQSKIR